MRPVTNLKGLRFGRLVVQQLSGSSDVGKKARWLCKCDCGGSVVVLGYNLRSGNTQSCGCLMRETSKSRLTTHGMSKTSTYQIWLKMHRRCYSKGWGSYAYYGGKGITVCKRWWRFENFFEDMGRRPEGATLDRIDSRKSYSPSNCRWASWRTQQNNRRNNHLVSFGGRRLTVAEWSREVGISQPLLLARLTRLGWSVERALTTPAGAH